MKKLSFIGVLATAFLLLLSCQKPAEPEVVPVLKLSTKTVTFPNEASATAINVVSNVEWSATVSDGSWLSVSPSSGKDNGTVSISASANVESASGKAAPRRQATVTFKAGEKSATVEVTQQEEPIIFVVTGETAYVPSSGGTVKVSVEHNADYQVDPGVDWISTSPFTKSSVTDNLTLYVAENKGFQSRNAVVGFSCGSTRNTVTVNQEGSDPTAKYSFGGGKGTKEDPYLITKWEQLDSLSYFSNSDIGDKFLNACYRQTVDISLKSHSFQPIAQNDKKPFKGSYDGDGHKISALNVAGAAASKASGFVAYADQATISNINFADCALDAQYVYAGAAVGYAKNGTLVQNCTMTGQVREYVTGINADGTNNEGYTGGMVGYLLESTVENCTVDGNVTVYGLFSGGVVGYASDSKIKDCKFLKENTVNVYYHKCGGIVGRAVGSKMLIEGCSFEGNLTTCGYDMGGIVGLLEGGTVKDCVLGSYADIGADKYAIGGIVGSAQPVAEIKIENCAAYGSVKGMYSVGGIVGFIGQGFSAIGSIAGAIKPVSVKGCGAYNRALVATGNNGGSNLYSLVAGIAGWTAAGPSSVLLSGCVSAPSVLESISSGNRGGLGGLSGYQNNAGSCIYEDSFCTLTPSTMLNCNDQVTSVTGTFFWGGIYARCTQPTTVRYCFCDSSMKLGPAEGKTTESGNEAMAIAKMTDGTLLGKLQAGANGVTWVAGPNGLPTIQGLPADPHVKPKAAKRVSVIGDSISTFKGWIPGNYAAHYPAADGTLTIVNETYWYRLIHDYMKSAEFDTNIAFSGSTVTNTTEENYKAKYGSATNSWWHNSFPERFAACGGCGRPDIILIHGGTNDWSHNADPLAPGVAIRNDSANSYGGNAPASDVMSAIFSKADAAKTRAEVNALPDGTFCEAYVKLLCQIRERYPKCKVVCIIGDYLSQSIEQSTIQIAEHYGAKVVNLFRVNGFNDLGGYSPSTLSNKGKQPNMPKHDYSGDVSGCHPGSKAMEFIANKIYSELGAWLEE